jgi:hypothetical protein
LTIIEHQEPAPLALDLDNKRQLTIGQQCFELTVLESGGPREFSPFSFVNQLIDKA